MTFNLLGLIAEYAQHSKNHETWQRIATLTELMGSAMRPSYAVAQHRKAHVELALLPVILQAISADAGSPVALHSPCLLPADNLFQRAERLFGERGREELAYIYRVCNAYKVKKNHGKPKSAKQAQKHCNVSGCDYRLAGNGYCQKGHVQNRSTL